MFENQAMQMAHDKAQREETLVRIASLAVKMVDRLLAERPQRRNRHAKP
jgi:hypothetical protein